MSSKNFIKPEIIIERLRDAYGFTSDGQLAEKLGYSSTGTISNWKDTGSVRWNRIIEYCPDISLDYLTSGKQPAFRDSHEVEFMRLKDRLIHEDISDNERDLLIEVLESDAERLSDDFQELLQMIRKLRKSNGDSYD